MKVFIEKLEQLLEFGGTKKDVAFLVISGVALAISFFDFFHLPFDAAWIAIVLCGVPIIIEATIGLATAFDIKADVLVSLALVASVMTGEIFAAGEVAFIMQIGALLEDLTVAKARAGLEKLVRLTPQTARLIKEGEEIIVAADRVLVGDRVRVLPGERIPVDGVILTGQTSINQAVMSGESLPVDKGEGDEVLSGTVNQFGAFDMEALKVGADSSIQRMIQLVQSADAGKAKIVRLADRWATWVVVAAMVSALGVWAITGEILRAVTVLVVFCPCALVLATPTAIMAAIGNAAKGGFLVREGDALERLAKVVNIAFDKTGTLTCGKPRVVSVETFSSMTPSEIYGLAAAVEQFSEHPLGKAILSCYRETEGGPIARCENFQMIPGQGVIGTVDGKKALAGSEKLLSFQGISIPVEAAARAEKHLSRGSSVTYLSWGGSLVGIVALADTIRANSASLIDQLKKLGIHPVLLTGDNHNAAGEIARKLAIDEVHANCLPQKKLDYIDSCMGQGEAIAMIGDGINDAPALKKATVGIAMGGAGNDIAVDAADIVLVDDDVKRLPHLVALSKRMMRTIRFNLSFSMILNFLAIGLAFWGVLNPLLGALVHNAGSVFVIINSSLLLSWENGKGA